MKLLNFHKGWGRALIAGISILFGSVAATAQPYDTSCLDEIPEILDQIGADRSKGIDICEQAVPHVSFSLAGFTGGLSPNVFLTGSMDTLLNLKRGPGLARENSELDVILVPRTHDLWDVEFRSFGKPYEFESTSNYVVWSQIKRPINGVRNEIMPIDATSTRVFRCAKRETGSCATIYAFQFCPGYQFPKRSARDELLKVARPQVSTMSLIVRASTHDDIDPMFVNYHDITKFVRLVLERVLVQSCK